MIGGLYFLTTNINDEVVIFFWDGSFLYFKVNNFFLEWVYDCYTMSNLNPNSIKINNFEICGLKCKPHFDVIYTKSLIDNVFDFFFFEKFRPFFKNTFWVLFSVDL